MQEQVGKTGRLPIPEWMLQWWLEGEVDVAMMQNLVVLLSLGLLTFPDDLSCNSMINGILLINSRL